MTALFVRQQAPFKAYVGFHVSPPFFTKLFWSLNIDDVPKAKAGAIMYVTGGGDERPPSEAFYDAASSPGVTKAIGVLANAKHDDVMGNPQCTARRCLTGALGYMGYPTAWFAWRLGNDPVAARAFTPTGEFKQPSPHWTLNQLRLPL